MSIYTIEIIKPDFSKQASSAGIRGLGGCKGLPSTGL
jgi:hypothetical protein